MRLLFLLIAVLVGASSSNASPGFMGSCLDAPVSSEPEITVIAVLGALGLPGVRTSANCQRAEEMLAGRNSLDLSKRGIQDLSPLRSLTGFKLLNLSGNRIERVDGVSDLRDLAVLILSKNPLRTLDGIESLTLLKELEIQDSKISDLSRLKGLRELRTLNLAENAIADLRPLEKLDHVQHLDLTSNKVKSVASLVALRNLQLLRVAKNKIGDFKRLTLLENGHYDDEGRWIQLSIEGRHEQAGPPVSPPPKPEPPPGPCPDPDEEPLPDCPCGC